MSKLNFVIAKESDKHTCVGMIKDFYSLDKYPFDQQQAERNFTEIINDDSLGKFWILSVENKIIGYLILTFGYSFEYGGRDAFIDELYLKSEFRNKGYGTETLKKLDEIAANLGVKAVHLEVEKTNSAGVDLYSKNGFRGNNRSLLTKVVKK